MVFNYNIVGDILEVRVKSYKKKLFEAKCNINDGKEIKKILNDLKFKFGVDLFKIEQEIRKEKQKWVGFKT